MTTMRAQALPCSECGHLHFEGATIGYSRCPLAPECACPYDDGIVYDGCGDCDHAAHDGAVCIVIVARHMTGQGDGEGECMCGAAEADYRRWSLS